MKFPFLKINASPCEAFPDRHSCWRPIIPIHLYSIDKNKKVHYYALLDTGADYNLFHADMAEIIGVEYGEGKRQTMFGIEGEGISSYFHDIIVEIGGWKYKAYSGFSNFEGEKNLDKMPYGILGQAGFFDIFKVSFDYQKKEIEITPKDNSLLTPF
jgi:predicted aspartyl protease